MFLICHVTSCYHLFKRFCVTFWGKPLTVSHHLSKFGSNRLYCNGLCCITSDKPHDKRVMRLYGWELLIEYHNPAKFGGHKHCGSGDIKLLI